MDTRKELIQLFKLHKISDCSKWAITVNLFSTESEDFKQKLQKIGFVEKDFHNYGVRETCCGMESSDTNIYCSSYGNDAYRFRFESDGKFIEMMKGERKDLEVAG
jgi:hypothetical protein